MNSDLVIKYLLINIFTYLIALKISNTKNIKYIQSISIIIGSVIVTIIYSILKEYLNFTLLFMIAFFIQIMFVFVNTSNNSQYPKQKGTHPRHHSQFLESR